MMSVMKHTEAAAETAAKYDVSESFKKKVRGKLLLELLSPC